MVRFHRINNQNVQFTAEEEAAKDAEEAQDVTAAANRRTAVLQLATNKANAKASLKTKRWGMAPIIFYLFDFPGMSSEIFFKTKAIASDILSFSSFSLFAANSRTKAKANPSPIPNIPAKITICLFLGLVRCKGISGASKIIT